MEYVMRRVTFSLFALAILLVVDLPLMAQSNHDLAPPMQADTDSSQVQYSPDPDALPTFRFATAKLNEDGMIVVSTTNVAQKMIAALPGSVAGVDNAAGIPYTENVTQQYTVAVPYTEMVDGVAVQRIRTETRTRTVPVTRFRKRNAAEQAEFDEKMAERKKEEAGKEKPKVEFAKQEMVTINQTMQIPYTETVDGVPVQRMRSVQRQQTAMVMRGKTETTGVAKTDSYAVDAVQCFAVDGTAIESDLIKKRLAENSPVILINSEQAISPYFEAILKPNTIFMVCNGNEKMEKEEMKKEKMEKK